MAATWLTLYGLRWSACPTNIELDTLDESWSPYIELCQWTRNYDAHKVQTMVGQRRRLLSHLFGTIDVPDTCGREPRSLRIADNEKGLYFTYTPIDTPIENVRAELCAMVIALKNFSRRSASLTIDFSALTYDLFDRLGAVMSEAILFSALDIWCTLPCKFKHITIIKPAVKSSTMDGFFGLARRAFSEKMQARIAVTTASTDVDAHQNKKVLNV